jgi:hypothetical protein
MYHKEIITVDELEESLQDGRVPGENITSELYKYAHKNFQLRLLNFYNIHISGGTPKE